MLRKAILSLGDSIKRVIMSKNKQEIVYSTLLLAVLIVAVILRYGWLELISNMYDFLAYFLVTFVLLWQIANANTGYMPDKKFSGNIIAFSFGIIFLILFVIKLEDNYLLVKVFF